MTARKKPSTGAPRATRPHAPGYGIPESEKGLLPWSHVVEKMTAARRYWIATVGPDSRPHATPVDGLWKNGRFYFGGRPKTLWARNLMLNPAMVVHLEDALDLVALHGEAAPLEADDELAAQLAEASYAKYPEYFAKPPDSKLYQSEGTWEFRPHKGFAWSDFPKDATRFLFEGV